MEEQTKQKPRGNLFQNILVSGSTGIGKSYWVKKRIEEELQYLTNTDQPLNIADDGYCYINSVSKYGTTEKFGYSTYFISASYLLLKYKIDAFNFLDLYQKLINCVLLVIDDLGVSKSNDFQIDIIYSLIDARLQADKPTIVTTNLSLKDIAEKLDDRLANRFSTFLIISEKQLGNKSKRVVTDQDLSQFDY